MLNAIASLILVFTLILGGGGVTAVAAQGSLPDDPLYSLKLLGEDFRLWLAVDPQDKIDLLLTYSNRRTEEIQGMLQAGDTPPEAVQTRHQEQVEQAIRLAAQLPVTEIGLTLEKIRACLQAQEQAMLQLQINQPGTAEPVLQQTRQMLRERLGWVEEGLAAPEQLKIQIQQRDRDQVNKPTREPQSTQGSPGTGDGNPWASGTPTPGSGYGDGNGGNPWASGTPTPGSGYGDGNGGNPWASGTPTPGSGYGDGNGGNPWASGTPTPGSGGGGGNPGATPTPGGGTGPGPQPTSGGNPGGNH